MLWIAPLLLAVGVGAALPSGAEHPPAVAAIQIPLATAAAPTHTPSPPLSFYLGPIVGRNLFDSSPPVPITAAQSALPAALIASELPAQLISTSVASDPAWSTAMVRPSPKESSRILRIGARLHDGVVHAILRPRIGPAGKVLPARIVLERGGHLEYLDEDNKPPRVKKKKKRKRRKKSRTRKRRARKR